MIFKYLCIQKLLVTHPYKSMMTFGGCKQDFMLVVGQSIGTNTGKDKPTEKHLFAMDASKVSEISDCYWHECRPGEKWRFYKQISSVNGIKW